MKLRVAGNLEFEGPVPEIVELLRHVGATLMLPGPVGEAPKPASAPPPAARPTPGATETLLPCPECHTACRGTIGLGIHRKRMHGVDGVKLRRPGAKAPPPLGKPLPARMGRGPKPSKLSDEVMANVMTRVLRGEPVTEAMDAEYSGGNAALVNAVLRNMQRELGRDWPTAKVAWELLTSDRRLEIASRGFGAKPAAPAPGA